MELKQTFINLAENITINIRALYFKVKQFCFIKSAHPVINELIFYGAIALLGYFLIRLFFWVSSYLFKGFMLIILLIIILLFYICY